MMSKSMSQRIQDRLPEVGAPQPGGGGKCDKRRRKRVQSLAYRMARVLARKDRNVEKSSHGKWKTVEEMVESSRPKRG